MTDPMTRKKAQALLDGRHLDGMIYQFPTLAAECRRALQTIIAQDDERERLRGQLLLALSMMYAVAPQTVARLCDEELDRSGAMLGEVRELAARATLKETSNAK